jgi:hypothetical protein
MKQYIVPLVVIALIAFSLVQPPVSSTTNWMTYREDITISAITVDIDYESTNVTGNNVSINVTLPCTLAQLNQTMTILKLNSTDNVSFNLTVNGHLLNNTEVLYGNWSNTTLAKMLETVDQNNTYINVTIEVNNTNNLTAYGRLYANDANCTSTWVISVQTVKEKDIVKPTIGTSLRTSFMTVNNSINITHTLGYNLTDVNATLTYPSQAISTTSYHNFGTLVNNTGKETYKNYQKYGPYVYKIEDDSDDENHEVTIYARSNELLTLTVDYSLIPSNDVDVDWEEGSVEFEDLTVKEGWSLNKFTLSWTETVEPTPEAVEWWNQVYFGLALWVWLFIAIAIIAIIILIILSYKS